jgi:hypothetical protein
MAAEKLSISLDADLAGEVRSAAAADGVSVSTWLADAALVKARQRHLRTALDLFAAEFGALSEGDVDRLVAESRTDSIVSQPGAA